MTKLLYIKASPRGAESKSISIADAYLAALKVSTPNLVVDVLDVWQEQLPEFDGNKVNAKMSVITGVAHGAEEKTAWDELTALANRFIAADHYLFAVPMWNGGIPYPLKHYIDLIHQPGLLFGLDPANGYFGLLKNKRATIAYTSGAYSPATPPPAFGADHHSTYLRAWLNQAGVTTIEEIRFQPTLLTADPKSDFVAAITAAGDAAKRASSGQASGAAQSPRDIVSSFYAAIACGDVDAILSLLHPNLEWTEAEGFPYYSGTWRTPQEVVEKLLVPLARDWKDFSAAPNDYIEVGDQVVAFGVYGGIANATGKTMRAAFAHRWKIRDGRLARFDMYTDTALVRAALVA